jgi:hypothetical protein
LREIDAMATVPATRPARQRPKSRGVRLQGDQGDALRVLVLREGEGEQQKVRHYYLSEVPSDLGGRGFLLEKWHTERKPGEPDAYHVHVGGEQESCECRGHLRWSFRTVCKHRASIRKLISEGRL